MKKIIAIAVSAVLFTSSMFALDLSVGGKAILGKNVAEGESVSTTIKSAASDKNFDFGGSVYVNLSILGGLGAQVEANYINSSINLAYEDGDDPTKNRTQAYDTKILDIAPMIWWNGDIWKLRIGLGAGPNFSIALSDLSEVKTAQKDQFVTGLCAGADVRLYFSDNFGIVVSARYIGEFNQKENTVEVAGLNVAEYPTYSTKRQTIYGGIGAEIKLF